VKLVAQPIQAARLLRVSEWCALSAAVDAIIFIAACAGIDWAAGRFDDKT
jgi:hypothetical protein